MTTAFDQLCASRDEDGHPLGKDGKRLSGHILKDDPLYEWTIVHPSGVTPEAAIRVNGRFASRCRGAY